MNGGPRRHLPATLLRSPHRHRRSPLRRRLLHRRWCVSEPLPSGGVRGVDRAGGDHGGPVPQRRGEDYRGVRVGEDGGVPATGGGAVGAVRAVPGDRVRGDQVGATRVEGQGEPYA